MTHESHHEDLDEGDPCPRRPRWPLASASGTEDCLVMFSIFHCAMRLYSQRSSSLRGVAVSSLIGVVRFFFGPCSKSCSVEEARQSPYFQLLMSVKSFSMSDYVYVLCSFVSIWHCSYFEIELHDRFVIVCISADIMSCFAFLSFFVILQSLHDVDLFWAFFNAEFVNSKDVHDGSSVDSLFCMLLDLLGNACVVCFHKC